LQDTLLALGDERALAERILIAMASPGAGDWVSPDGLCLDSTDSEAAGAVLARLAGLGLLERRLSEAGPLYAFAAAPVIEEVYNLAGDEIEQRALAARELGRIWAAWAAHRDLAARFQMRQLAAYGIALSPTPLESLLLIRSAQALNEPAIPWLASLSGLPGRSLARILEGLPAEAKTWYFSESELAEAHLLLGISAGPASPAPLVTNRSSQGAATLAGGEEAADRFRNTWLRPLARCLREDLPFARWLP
jgi:hypothetical protein